MSSTVDSLSQRDLIERHQVSDDQRAAALQVTASGRILLEAVEHEMLARMEDLCRRTPDGDRLIEARGWLGAALDQRRAERLERERAKPGRPG